MKEVIGFIFIIVMVTGMILHLVNITRDDVVIKTDLETVCKGTKVEFDDELFMVECQPVTCYVKKDKIITCTTK